MEQARATAGSPAASPLFVSHASQDAAAVWPIVRYLEAAGLPCWIAPRNIPPKAIYAEAIAEAMKTASACAVVVSQAANASAAVKRELELAVRFQRPLVPIRIDETEPAAGLDYYLGGVQWLDYQAEREAALDRLVLEMRAKPSQPPPSRFERRPRVHARPRAGPWFGAGVGLAGLAALAVLVGRQGAEPLAGEPRGPQQPPLVVAPATLGQRLRVEVRPATPQSAALAQQLQQEIERTAAGLAAGRTDENVQVGVVLESAITDVAARRARAEARVRLSAASGAGCEIALESSGAERALATDLARGIIEAARPLAEGAKGC